MTGWGGRRGWTAARTCRSRRVSTASEPASSRRAFLAGTGIAVTGLAGCLETSDDSPSADDSLSGDDSSTAGESSDDATTIDSDENAGVTVDGHPPPDDDDGPEQLVTWNRELLDIIRFVGQTPTGVTRHLGLFAVAMYDAVATITLARGEAAYEPYGAYDENVNGGIDGSVGGDVDGGVTGDASRPAALSGAAHEVLSHMYPAFTAQFDQTLAGTLGRAAELGGDVSGGEEWGRTIARHVIESRTDDGHDDVEEGGYRPCANPDETPGCWRGGSIGTWRHSHFAFLDTWVLDDPVPFGSPPELATPAYADAWHEVYDLGARGPDKPQEHVDIATFWRGGAGTTRPSGRWFRIANQAALAFELSLLDSARLLALVGLGLGDAGVSTWRSKHRHGYWRPAAAIHHADTDGNPETDADPGWQPVAVGGGPEYPSALSCYGSTAKTILVECLGTDEFPFEFHSAGPPEQTRSFESFSEALDESLLSRLYIGNHFRFSLDDAIAPGEEIAAAVLESLPPVD